MKVKNTLDLDGNQVVNILLDKRATPPSNGAESQFYYNSSADKKGIYYHNGVKWVKVGGLDKVTNTGGGLNVNIVDEVANVDINVDNATLEIGANTLRIKDSGVVTNKIANNAVTTVKLLDKNVTFSKINDIPTMTVIGRVTAGSGVSSAITILNSDTMAGANASTLATSGSIKAYVDAKVASIGSLIGGWDAMTNDKFPGGADTKKGDYWYVTVAGTIQGVPFQVGDAIVANQASPTNTNANHYMFLQTNADQATTTILGMVMLASDTEVQAGVDNKKSITPASLSARTATETRTGLAKIATTAEALAGTDNTTIMTPQKVKALLDSSIAKGHTALIGNNTATEILVSHTLNTDKLIADFFDENKKDKVLVDYAPVSVSQVKVTTSKPLSTNELRIVIVPIGV